MFVKELGKGVQFALFEVVERGRKLKWLGSEQFKNTLNYFRSVEKTMEVGSENVALKVDPAEVRSVRLDPKKLKNGSG